MRRIFNFKNKIKIAIALSGGVDSAVAAKLLKDKGYDLTAFYLKLREQDQGARYARKVAARLKIPFYEMDAQDEFNRKIIQYFIHECKNGGTPNPCVKCNKDIKFGVLYEKARELGFAKLATGHYIKKFKILNSKFKKWGLQVAKDKEKDQSYFLYNLTQDILNHIEFPLGNLAKKQVIAMAGKWHLPVNKKESQDICFLQNANLREWDPSHKGGARSKLTRMTHNEFLKEYLKMKKGDIVTAEGKKVGMHMGLPSYTIGQRRVVGIGGTGPYYVIEKDFKNNSLIVSNDKNDPRLFSGELIVGNVNWISGHEPKLPFKVKAKIRYRQEPAADASVNKVAGEEGKEGVEKGIKPLEIRNCLPAQAGLPVEASAQAGHLEIGRRYIVKFKSPQRAIASGQSVVFYIGKEMLGGGTIE